MTKQADADIRQLQELVERLPSAAAYVKDGVLALNRAAEELTGYPRHELASVNTWFRRLYGSAQEAVRGYYEAGAAAGFQTPRTVSITRKDGETRVVEFTVGRTTDGEIWLMHDVTARHRAHEALQQSEARLSALFASAMDGIIMLDGGQHIVSFNHAAEIMFDCTAADAIGQSIDRFIPARFREAHREHIQRFGETLETTRRMGQLGEVRGLRTNGEEFPIEASISHIHKPASYYTVVLRDISERKAAERQFRTLAQNVPELFAYVGSDQRYRYVNLRYEQLFGRTDIVGKTIAELVGYAQYAKTRHHIERALKGEEVRFETELGHASGTRVLHLTLIPHVDDHTDVQGFFVLATDLTELRRTAERLHESERKLSTLIDNLPGAVYRCRNDRHRTAEYVSDGVKAVTGYPAADFVEQQVAVGQLIHLEDRDDVWKQVQAALRDRDAYQLTYRIRTAKGEEAWIWEHGEGVYGPGGEVVALEGFLTDITEQREAEAKLREQAALARLGQMAAVVAHEVKNPLAGTQGVLQILRKRPGLSDRDKGAVEEVLNRLSSLNYLLTDVLTYAKPPGVTLEPVALAPLCRELVSMASHDPALSGIEMELEAPDGEALLPADSKQLERVFSNLLLNGAQAMNGTGHLRLAVNDADSHYRVTIQDSGPGIPEEVRSKIFEPFFTTKRRGSGLGLAICRQVVEQHKGTISIDSPPEGGTMVTVSLPRG